MAQDKNLKPLKDQDDAKKHGYTPNGDEAKVWSAFLRRKSELLNSRKNVYGLDIDAEMRRMDKMYFRKQADIPVSELDANQRPLAINNAYGKIQTALGILIDRNPKYILEEDNPKYSANRALLKALGEKSFRRTNSLGQFKLSVFNQAKRGWFIGRTFNRQLQHDARFLKSIDDKGKRAYETRKVTKLDDVAYMNLNNFNTWLDEQTRPDDFFSTRDWMWREVWYIDDLRETFPESEFPNMKYVSSGGDTRETIEGVYAVTTSKGQTSSPQSQKPGMTEVFFYENQYADQFIIEMNGVMVVWEPLPQNNKRLSCSYGYWHLRGDDTPYGIGVIEEMEHDEEYIDRINNMDMRQLLLTIAPGGFYSGTEDMEDENMKITPGVFRRTMNPKDVTWLQIPEGNQKGMERVDWIERKQEDKTGISKILEGGMQETETGTAFETGVRRESGLRRLRLPLKSIQYALDNEFNNRIALIQQVYSDFQVEHLVDQEKINAYLDEVGEDPDFYFIENEGVPGKEVFYAKKVRSEMLNLEQAEDGDYVETESPSFFHIKPEMLAFTGIATTDISSLLINSEELEKAETLRMVNLLTPMLAMPMEQTAKLAKQLLQAYNKDIQKWLPQEWIDFLAGKKKQEKKPNGLPGSVLPPEQQELPKPMGGAPTVVPQSEIEGIPSEGFVSQ